MDIKILIATHKKYWMPKDDIYLPIHVGREGKPDIGYISDNTGDNISIKNPNYCELTALYWAWKNIEADYIGIAHYRRHYTLNNTLFKNSDKKKSLTITRNEIENILKKYDGIVPNKRNYYIETNYSHYIHAHNKRDLDVTCEVINELYPEYTEICNKVMNRTYSHMFNMFVLKKEYYDSYCKWLFDILFEVEKRVDISNYNSVEARIFGYLSELLLDIWIEKNNINVKEVNVMFMEKQNWLIKGFNFIKRKSMYRY